MESGKTSAKLSDKMLFVRQSTGMSAGEKVGTIFDMTTCWTQRTGSWSPAMYHNANRIRIDDNIVR